MNQQDAKKLLHAMTDVDEQYIQDAIRFAEENEPAKNVAEDRRRRTFRFQRNAGVLVALAACLAVVAISARVTGIFQPKGMGTASSAPAETEESYDLGISSNEAAASAEMTGEAEDYAVAESAAGSPYQEVSSLSEAEAITGFSMQVPSAEPDESQTITVIDGSMIEVMYTAQATEGATEEAAAESERAAGTRNSTAQDALNDQAAQGTTDQEESSVADTVASGYYIRKAAMTDNTAEDISGDYNTYTDTMTAEQEGTTITLKGSAADDAWSVAVWSSNGYNYAICAQDTPFSKTQMLQLAGEVK